MIDLEDFREEHEAAIAAAQPKTARNDTWGPFMAAAMRGAHRRPRVVVVLMF